MLRLTLTLVPRGDERAPRDLGTVEIENDGTGSEEVGDYRLRMRGTLHRGATLRQFLRTRGCWSLAFQALRVLLARDA